MILRENAALAAPAVPALALYLFGAADCIKQTPVNDFWTSS